MENATTQYSAKTFSSSPFASVRARANRIAEFKSTDVAEFFGPATEEETEKRRQSAWAELHLAESRLVALEIKLTINADPERSGYVEKLLRSRMQSEVRFAALRLMLDDEESVIGVLRIRVGAAEIDRFLKWGDQFGGPQGVNYLAGRL